MEKSNEEDKRTMCKKQTAEYFEGKIRNVNRFEYDEYMKDHFVALDIVPDTGNSITYQFYYEDAKDKLNFIEKNDSISKHENSKSFTVIKRNGTRKEFKIPSCE